MAELKVSNLTYVYGEKTPFEIKALDDISLTLPEGKILGIIGHTGSGKSTLVQMLNGIMKPKSGSVLFEGQDIFKNKKTLYEARFRIGLVFQYPEYQLFDETVRKDMAFGPRNMKLPEEEIDKRIREACAFVGLSEDLLDKSPFELSGGQKRRAAIAGVMVMKPQILILDEPASGLDPVGRRAIFEGILDYKEKTGASVVIVSHSMEDMALYADDILVLDKGKILMLADKRTVFSQSDLLESAGLGLPTVARIAKKLRDRGVDIPPDLFTPEEAAEAIMKAGGRK